MKNKRIIVSESEKKSILNMHESYKNSGFILEDDKNSKFPICVTSRNNRISNGFGFRGGDYIIIDNKQYYEDGIVCYDSDLCYYYSCSTSPNQAYNEIIQSKEPISEPSQDCITSKSPDAQRSFYALDRACNNYILSDAYKGFWSTGSLGGIVGTWDDRDIRKAILVLNDKKDLNDLKEIIDCQTGGNLTLDDILKKGMFSWSDDYKKTYEWINNLK